MTDLQEQKESSLVNSVAGCGQETPTREKACTESPHEVMKGPIKLWDKDSAPGTCKGSAGVSSRPLSLNPYQKPAMIMTSRLLTMAITFNTALGSLDEGTQFSEKLKN